MLARRSLSFGAALITCLSCSRALVTAAPPRRPVVRLAELDIARRSSGRT